jgi:hypothetical protein
MFCLDGGYMIPGLYSKCRFLFMMRNVLWTCRDITITITIAIMTVTVTVTVTSTMMIMMTVLGQQGGRVEFQFSDFWSLCASWSSRSKLSIRGFSFFSCIRCFFCPCYKQLTTRTISGIKWKPRTSITKYIYGHVYISIYVQSIPLITSSEAR